MNSSESNGARVWDVVKLLPGSTWTVPSSANVEGGFAQRKLKHLNRLTIYHHIIKLKSLTYC